MIERIVTNRTAETFEKHYSVSIWNSTVTLHTIYFLVLSDGITVLRHVTEKETCSIVVDDCVAGVFFDTGSLQEVLRHPPGGAVPADSDDVDRHAVCTAYPHLSVNHCVYHRSARYIYHSIWKTGSDSETFI